uniref:Uncharacterized protein LOC111114838 n=1 Tax=Crassostrea virginica TaxID=6565 RepID=A0A8B8C0F3_CRAVI|nr:uncharacterized protein LOC111114838 [Crassostrea virginica]
MLLKCLSMLICVGLSWQYTTEELRSLLSYDCSNDGSIELRGVPDGFTVTVISTFCTVYLIAPGQYNIPNSCKTYNYWEYQHGYPTSNRYRYYSTTNWYYTTRYTTVWYQSSTSNYYGEVDISVSRGSHSGIVGGKDHHEFRLVCDSLHTGGELYRVSGGIEEVSNSNHAVPTLSYRQQKLLRSGYAHSPSLRITNDVGQDVYQTHAGQLIYLLVSSNDPRYVIRPENCSAHDGSYYWSDENQIELFNIHRSGCLLEPYLMEMFAPVGHGQSSVRAPVYSFHFPRRQYVTFICNVRVCTKSSYNCDMSVCKSNRLPRDADDEAIHSHDQLTVSLHVGPASGQYQNHMTCI